MTARETVFYILSCESGSRCRNESASVEVGGVAQNWNTAVGMYFSLIVSVF